jgi:hypothetical protein
MGDAQQKPCKDSEPPKEDYGQKPPEGGGYGDKPKPPEGGGYGDKPKPPEGGDYGDKPKPPEGGYGEPKPPRDCGKPEPPENPCGDPTPDPVPPPPPENCDKRPFDDEIKQLEGLANQEERDTKREALAKYKKLSDDVAKAEKDYAKEYDSLVRQEQAAETYTDDLKILLDSKLTPSEKKRIAEIVYCAPNLDELKKAWQDARDELPELQKILTVAQNAFDDQDAEYKTALTKYQDAQKALDEIQTQSTKAVDAKNYRGAWFLNQFEECPNLKVPPVPCKFNEWLEGIAKKEVEKSEAVRQAKVTLDQKTADAQKKKKEYEDAKAKRRENILKAIAADPFPVPPPPKDKTSQESSSESKAG